MTLDVAEDQRAVRTSSSPDQNLGPEPDSSEAVMPLVEHLAELRNRIIKALFAVGLGSLVGLYFNNQIRDFLLQPLPGHSVQVLSPGDAFSITVRIAVITGVILAMPVIIYQAWAFIAPGLTNTERRAIRPWVPVSLVFFGLGMLLAWIVLPVAIGFLLGFTDESLRADLAAGPYFEFVGTLFLGFGLAMQYPIVLMALARIGLISSHKLRSWRRYALLSTVVIAVAITPPDAFSDIAMAVVLYALYELTTFVVARTGR